MSGRFIQVEELRTAGWRRRRLRLVVERILTGAFILAIAALAVAYRTGRFR